MLNKNGLRIAKMSVGLTTKLCLQSASFSFRSICIWQTNFFCNLLQIRTRLKFHPPSCFPTVNRGSKTMGVTLTQLEISHFCGEFAMDIMWHITEDTVFLKTRSCKVLISSCNVIITNSHSNQLEPAMLTSLQGQGLN